jgi:ATP-binding cassette subfamily G (WHITE) protein 2
MGLLFFVLMNQVFGQMGSMSVFIEERLIFSRERASGFYTTFPYFIVRLKARIFASGSSGGSLSEGLSLHSAVSAL